MSRISYTSDKFYQLEDACDRGVMDAITIRNLRNYLARKNATVLWGGGCGINTDDEQIQSFFDDYAKRYKFLDIATWCEEACSLYGRSVITINKTKKGEYMLYVPDPLFFNVVGTTFYKEDLAVVWQRFTHDNKHWWIKSIYTPEKVINQVRQSTDQLDRETFIVTEKSKIPVELQVEEVWNHNLGFLPLVEIQNYPNLYSFQNTLITWNKCADWYNASILEPLFVQAIKDFKKELRLCHSRVAIENASQQILQDISEKIAGANEDATDDILKDVVIDTPTGSKVSVLHGVADFSSYTKAIDAVMDLYCKLANGSKFSEGGSAQKTTQEVRGTRSQQIEAINLKTLLREKIYSELLAKLFTCYGLMNYNNKDKWPFNFKIHGNISREDTVFIDNIVKQLSLGTMSTIEAIAEIRKITKPQAEQIFNEIKEFNETNNIVSNITEPTFEEPGEEEDNENGRPPETDEVL